MDSKHTPGPWHTSKVAEPSGHDIGTWIVAENLVVCRAGRLQDARLIACAPEMLATLDLIRAWMSSTNQGGDLKAMIEGLLSRATGGES